MPEESLLYFITYYFQESPQQYQKIFYDSGIDMKLLVSYIFSAEDQMIKTQLFFLDITCFTYSELPSPKNTT